MINFIFKVIFEVLYYLDCFVSGITPSENEEIERKENEFL